MLNAQLAVGMLLKKKKNLSTDECSDWVLSSKYLQGNFILHILDEYVKT